jgi:hypothetical protein
MAGNFWRDDRHVTLQQRFTIGTDGGKSLMKIPHKYSEHSLNGGAQTNRTIIQPATTGDRMRIPVFSPSGPL